MTQFKILIVGRHTNLCLSSFNALKENVDNPFGTYNEQLSKSDNDQYQLTFSMTQYIDGQYNYYLDLLPIGAKIRLIIDESESIDLTITDKNPTINEGNISYSFSAQDYVSFKWAKIGIGYSYSSFDDDDGKVHRIDYYGNKILKDNGISGWKCKIQSDELAGRAVSFEISDSNVYNALVELAATLNAKFHVNYNNHTITFYSNKTKRFSGYRLSTDTNINSLGISSSGSELTTLLKCSGGEDEYGSIISIVPAIPEAMRKWFNEYRQMPLIYGGENIGEWEDRSNFPADWYSKIVAYIIEYNPIMLYLTYSPDTDEYKQEVEELKNFATIADKVPYLSQYLIDFSYFTNCGLLTADEKAQIDNIFNVKMRKNNIDYKYYTSLMLKLEWEIQSIISKCEVNAKLYEAEWLSFSEKDADNRNEQETRNKTEEYVQAIRDIIVKDDYSFFKSLVRYYGSLKEGNKWSFETINNLLDDAAYYDKLVDDIQKQIEKIEGEIGNPPSYKNDEEKIELETNLELQKTRLKTAKTKSTSWEVAKGKEVAGISQLVYNIIVEELDKWDEQKKYNPLETSLTSIVNQYKVIDDGYWAELNNFFGDFIYENSYENADELDSVSLYNQSISYFQDIKNPAIIYNITTIDLGALELVDIPSLDIGTTISVHDRRLKPVKNYSLTDGAIVVTSLNYTLRNPSSVSISVENYVPYQKILSKLIKTVSKK